MILRRKQSFFEFKDAGLLRSVLNEVLNAFVVDDFEAVIGINQAELGELLTQLNGFADHAAVRLDVSQTRAVRNALRTTLHELGVEEFHTRTGHDFEKGKRVLKELDDAIEGELDE